MESFTANKWKIKNNGTPKNVWALIQISAHKTRFEKKTLILTPINIGGFVKPIAR